MNIYIVALVIFLTSLLVLLVAALVTSSPTRIPLGRLADPAPLPGELPRAGLFDVEYLPGPPFAGASDRGYELVDTGPLLLMSDQMAAVQSHEREVRAMIEAAERKIGPVKP